jgi:hypothetical protein
MNASQSTFKELFFGIAEPNIINEHVGDVPLLLAHMIKMGMPTAVDRHIPQSNGQRKLSRGWTASG